MRRTITLAMVLAILAAVCVGTARAAEPLKVTSDENNILRVNGRKFLPIAVWLEPEDTFAMWKDLGINVFMASSNPRREGTIDTYLKAAEEHNVYVSIGYRWAKRENKLDEVLKHPLVFTLHHNDEPDKPRTVSDAKIEPGPTMRVNATRPLFTMFDGNLGTSAVVDPPQGVSFTITAPAAVTVVKLAVAAAAGNYTVPHEIEFLGDGQPLARLEMKKAAGLQEVALEKPATFRALTVKVVSSYEGGGGFDAIAEVQGLDAEGKNVLAFPTRLSATGTPEEVLADYQAIKALQPDRLVSLCLMARFMPEVKFQKLPMEAYKQYPAATDLLMFDLYPVSVYKGKNLHWNALGLDQLRQMAGPKKALGIWLQASDAMNANDPGMTPTQMRANAWLSLAHGATFIGYFPQTFNPKFKFHDINEERRAALKAVNAEITALADVILTPPKSDLFTVQAEGARVDAMQRLSDAGDKALLVLVNVVESGAGAPVAVKISPKEFQAAGPPVRQSTGKPLAEENGAWTVELQPWETAVLVVDRAK